MPTSSLSRRSFVFAVLRLFSLAILGALTEATLLPSVTRGEYSATRVRNGKPATDKIRVEWVSEESRSEEFARKAGGTVLERGPWEPGSDALDDYGDTFFEPLTAVVMIVGAGWLIARLAEIVADHRQPGGQLVDTRKDVLVRPLPKVPRGTIVIVTNGGTQVFPPNRSDEALAALTQIFKLGRG